jgi:hypothetical protein
VVLHLLAPGGMLIIIMLAAALFQSQKIDVFSTQADIQGLYEDIRLHDVLYTQDWTFVDKSGQSHAWSEWRRKEIDALAHRSGDAFYQPIKKLSVSSDGQTATVTIGENGATYKDTWVRSGPSWKMKTRQQIE